MSAGLLRSLPHLLLLALMRLNGRFLSIADVRLA